MLQKHSLIVNYTALIVFHLLFNCKFTQQFLLCIGKVIFRRFA